MRIDVFADLACPWCFIGKRRLEAALTRRALLAPTILWRPFQLNPDLPAQGMARPDFLAARFGGTRHAERIHDAVRQAGASVGIAFAFERIGRTPNTRNAHRLVRHAAHMRLADAVVEALFAAYFCEGRDIGDRATLARIADEVGLDRQRVRAYLASEEDLVEVAAEEREARRFGITAVPCFVFAERYALSGAQEPEFFLPIFDLVTAGPIRAAV